MIYNPELYFDDTGLRSVTACNGVAAFAGILVLLSDDAGKHAAASGFRRFRKEGCA
jgi:hypothetical protein